MMSKLRSLIVWSVVFTQVWSPVLAQTLPSSVDRSVPGARPSVGVSHGVPVVNIAPPSAGGVSNNRYTQFNVGPSGVVLNNSGGASQTQLAGQVSGNLMLGNRHAGTILNQVTAPNPSQLLGTLEVAGNRANVIVANPAGITCNGCGFLNADRATLTTGKPRVGPDGGIGFDVTTGRLAVEGQGLNGMNLSQVDLLARTLEINAGIWANRLNVTAGASRVDYGSDAISAQAGDGPAPIVALDTAALGGMYANSIRLIGTEAGVGVNIGGNLAALTGDLQVNAAGDVRIAPRATVQAAGDLRVNSGGTLAVQGAAQATGAVTLAATADVSVPGAVGAGALLSMNAGGDVAVGPLGSLRTQGALRVAAGRDLSMSARLLTSGQDARMQSGRNLTVAGQAAMPPPVQGGAADSGAAAQAGAASVEPSNAPADSRGGVSLEGGRVSAKDGVTLQAGRDLVLPQQVVAAGTLLTEADGNLTLAAGTQLQSAGNVTMRAGHDVSLGGTVLTDAALSLTSGNDLVLGSTGKLQGERVDTSAGRDLALGGTLVSTADVQARATRDTRVDGKLSAGGSLDLDAGRHLSVGAAGQADASGKTRMLAAGDLSLAGTTRGNLGMRVEAGGRVDLSGATASANGPLDLIAGRAMHLSADSQALAGGAMQARAGSTLTAAGAMTSLGDLILDSSGNQRLAGQHFAAGNLVIQTRSELTTLAGSQQQANGSILARADSGALAGTLEAGQAATLRVEKDLTVDGTVLADAGALEASSGGAMLLGSASALQAGGSLTARAGSKLLANGTISGRQDITLKAGTNAQLNGKTVANATLRIDASDDLTIGETGLAQGSARLLLRADQDLRIAGIAGTAKGAEMGADRGMLQAQAARDLLITGTATAGSPVILGAQRDIRIDGVATALDGVLTADAGANLEVAATGRMQASQNLNASAGAQLDADGVIAAGGGLTLAAKGDVRVGGLAAALGGRSAGDASLTAGSDVVVKQDGSLQAAGTLTANARRSLFVAGALSSVGDMRLAATHDAHLNGTTATDATLTLTGRDVAVGTAGLVQAGRTLNASASGELEVAGRMLSGGSQSLTAGDSLRVDGTAAALLGDLSLTAQRGDLALHATSRQQAGGGLTAQAGGALTALGSMVAQHGMTLRAGTDATLGGLAATQTGDLDIHAAGALSTTTDARLQSGAALDLSAGVALGNAGIATAAGRASLKAGTTLDNMGSVLAGGDLIASAAGQLANAGQFVAGVDTDGALNLPGSLTLAAGSIVHRGASLAGGTLSLSADGLDLTDGKLSAISKVALSTPGDVDSRNAVVQSGTLDVTAANLRNQGGELAATSDAAITLGGNLDNTGGRIGAAGTARIEAAAIANRHGILAGRDVTITATSSPAPTRAVDNRAGLIQADNALTLRAASLDNSGTLTMDGDPSKGVLAKVIDILADRVGNQTGSVRAREDLTLAAKDLDNTGGEIVSQGNARILADGLNNAEGKLLADKRLTVTTKVLQGLGTLQSAGDLSLQYAGSLSQEGDIASGRDLALSVGGDMDNRARISAVRDLTITADSLNNQASGELLAGGANAITVARGLTNAGLIDGGSTRIAADRLENTGRVYGDTLSIQAGTLVNGAGAGGGAVIASRGNMNLGVGSLTNRDHALIYSGADLRIGGALDAQGAAVDQAASLLNASAVIEAVGDADISAAFIRNQNDHYASETAQVSSKPKVYFRTLNSQVMYDADTNWLCETDRPVCGKDPLTFLENDSNHRFLLPSDKYPASRYGPPFDYAPFVVGDKKGPNVPIAPAVVPRITVCASADGSRGCQFEGPLVSAHRATRPIHVYATDASIWQVFGVTPPDGPMPTWTPYIACSDKPGVCAERQAARRRAYEQAFAQYQAPFQELNARIYAFNQEYKRRLVEGFYYYIVTETVTETRTTATDPAKILSGGGMALTGVVTNDKSQIAAGGMLSVQGPAIVNIGAAGTRSITRAGTQVFTDEHGRRRTESRSPYNETMAAEPIELPVGTSGSNVGVALVGSSPGASRPPAPGTVQIASVTLPGHAAVRSVSNPVSIPDSQLFAVSGKPDAPYIVATDPRFVGPHPSVSSDYLLDVLRRPGASPGTPMGAATAGKEPSDARLSDWSALLPPGAGFLTPTGQPRRLGDGFYEQRLVSDQILASSGQRFLENYSDYDAQYKALMTEGARFGQLNGLKVGVALSEAQQRQLTADLVWLVEETVTLPDGTTEAVLVPRVYLLVRPTDLKGDGTLMAGRDVTLAAEGDIVNSGTIGARAATVMTSANILNQAGGRIQGALVDLSAREYLTNLASLIKGAAVALSAGNDIALTSTTASENFGSTWGTHLSGVSSVDAGRLNLQAGRDITLTAAQVSASEDAYLQAGRDVRLETVARNHGERIVGDARNRHELMASREIGATLTAGGDMTWIAGQDVNARVADATAGKQLAVHAGRDLNVAAGVAAGSTYAESYRKKRGFLSSSTSHTISSSAWEQAQASTLTGDTAVLTAGRDLNVTGSNVGAQHDLTASARRDVNILPGENTSDRYDYKMVKKSGLGAMGGLSYGTRRQTDSLDGKNVFHTASTVGSVEGDTLIRAERALNVTGSNVLARQGDVTLTGRGINIAAALDTTRDKELHEVKQSGASINASAPLISAMQTAGRMNEAAGKTDNKVMQGLALATTGLAALNAYDAMMADPKSAGGVSLSIDLGTSKSQSATDRASSSTAGSTVAAGQDLTLLAQGAGSASDITLTGSRLSAGGNVLLEADGNIQLRAAQNTFEQNTKNKSSSASVGIGVSADSENGAGVMVTIGVSGARGRADGKDTRWTYADVSAGNVLALRSGADTSLIGATGRADRIIASVGKDLRLETLQDASTYDAKQQSIGVKANICVYGYCKSSVSGHVAQGRMNSDFRSASEQAGLKAGDGGFQLDIARNTTLVGAAISSSERAALEGRNALGTDTLDVQDVKNTARYKADQIALSGGYSWGGDGGGAPKKGDAGKADVAANANGQAAGGADTARESGDKGGASAGLPVVAGASGKASSTTRSAISGGNVVIRDEVAQQDLTGLTATQTIAALNRDTSSDTLNALKPIFDKEKIEAGFEIASEVNRQVGQFLETRAREAKALEDALKNEPEGPRRDQLKQAFEDAKTWGPGGESRRWLTAILGAVSGNVTGAAGDAIQATAVNYLQGLGATEVKKLVAQMEPGPKGEAARAALHAIVGCAGAASTGANCSAGALGAGVGAVLNALLDQDGKKLNPTEKEQRSNLVRSLVAGISTAVGADAVVATYSAALETESNHLTVLQQEGRIREWVQCKDTACRDEVRARYADLSKKQRAELVDCEGAECAKNARKLTALAASYDARASELLEKSRREGGLSEADREELKAVKGMSLLILSDRNEVLQRAILAGSEEAKKDAWNSIATEGALGAAAAVGAVRPNKISGNTKAPIGQKGKGSALPAPEPVTASNGLVYESSPKHTPGQTASRPNAGLEPRNSLDLFANSVQGKEGQRFAKDAEGNIHRFSDSNDGTWHWSGSTGDKRNGLEKDYIPIEIRRFFNFPGKGK
ncbi:two-partner secretion domain-containing protein [Achromobacter ruhlandii]|uniref:two-partner secretion domain-containing protein n=1 Tax=Achromobacter ruhlandii TaxID=72557 RepID=UPI0008651CDB|nr:hemagglutinin repeat-containing protein [Achromobacter ruhlandii]AOU90937.1 hemagglutinin-like protein [Achromobacter ruhlandii]MDC6089013.1 hemagglutinin repeat-containing protein [Achromobacter ruhlandii]WIW03082.1 hemagglutinin repeat-containing protein [Achromobacter ruhlandii]